MRILTILLTLISISTTVYCQDNISIVKFKDITVEIKSLMPFDKEDLKMVFTDKAIFTADLGETLGASTIIVKSDKYKDIEIYQTVETSLTISNEGPHCDLTNWKHFTSESEKLKQINSDTFEAIKYNYDVGNKFPNVTIKEVIDAVRQECGDEWVKLIKDIKSIHEEPCSVGLSRYFLIIKATSKKTGEHIKRTIEINIPMGC